MTCQDSDTCFEVVLDQELSEIADLRAEGSELPSDADVYDRAYGANLRGLAFSGGGIRSATFNLGVIQALAKKKRLGAFDYLSTVSGGGYIGAWMSALLHRNKSNGVLDSGFVETFQSRLTTHPCKDTKIDCKAQSGFKDPCASGFPPVEHAAVRFLRGYSNYLTPRLGLSGDVLALISLFLRNIVLIQAVLVLFVALVLLVPYFFASISSAMQNGPDDMPVDLRTVLYIGLFLILYSLYSCGRALAQGTRISKQREAATALSADERALQLDKLREEQSRASLSVIIRIIIPFAFAAWLVITGIAANTNMPAFLTSKPVWASLGALAYIIVWGIGFAISKVHKSSDTGNPKKHSTSNTTEVGKTKLVSKQTILRLFGSLGAAALAGALLGYLLFEGTSLVHSMASAGQTSIWHLVAFGPPIAMLGISLVVTLHIGASRNAFSEHDREWWARLGGFGLITAVCWAALFSVVIYAPPFAYWLGNEGIVAVGAWLVSSGVGAWVAQKSSTPNRQEGSTAKAIIIKVTPWFFIGGLLVVLSCVVYASVISYSGQSLDWISCDYSFSEAAKISVEQQAALTFRYVLHPMLLVAILAVVASRVFDINLFSAHSLYKNRLTRAYLGASRAGQRNPHPFTGFDPQDDLDLSSLVGQRPIHVLNTTINMTGGDDLAWQTRRAASFAITPYQCGYEAKSTQGVRLGCYRPTSKFADRITLGTALAISGAAASPNMGYHTSASVAALLTAFNLRLGYWAGNPAHTDAWKKESPSDAMKPILAELTGSAKADSAWINLSDGGHFENLGIYELIRRRCRLVVVTDAGCDRDHQFDDLANAIRKCWTDFGVHIQLKDLQQLRLTGSDRKYCQVQSAVGKILYPAQDSSGKSLKGTIVYIKSSLTNQLHDNFPDIGQYADSHEAFPHETTVDQFFDENQFEAYRHLGFEAARDALDRFDDELSVFFGKEVP